MTSLVSNLVERAIRHIQSKPKNKTRNILGQKSKQLQHEQMLAHHQPPGHAQASFDRGSLNRGTKSLLEKSYHSRPLVHLEMERIFPGKRHNYSLPFCLYTSSSTIMLQIGQQAPPHHQTLSSPIGLESVQTTLPFYNNSLGSND